LWERRGQNVDVRGGPRNLCLHDELPPPADNDRPVRPRGVVLETERRTLSPSSYRCYAAERGSVPKQSKGADRASGGCLNVAEENPGNGRSSFPGDFTGGASFR